MLLQPKHHPLCSRPVHSLRDTFWLSVVPRLSRLLISWFGLAVCSSSFAFFRAFCYHRQCHQCHQFHQFHRLSVYFRCSSGGH
ncbi:unnamed protein product [Ectocarpus sp. 12 AP-2014]